MLLSYPGVICSALLACLRHPYAKTPKIGGCSPCKANRAICPLAQWRGFCGIKDCQDAFDLEENQWEPWDYTQRCFYGHMGSSVTYKLGTILYELSDTSGVSVLSQDWQKRNQIACLWTLCGWGKDSSSRCVGSPIIFLLIKCTWEKRNVRD